MFRLGGSTEKLFHSQFTYVPMYHMEKELCEPWTAWRQLLYKMKLKGLPVLALPTYTSSLLHKVTHSLLHLLPTPNTV